MNEADGIPVTVKWCGEWYELGRSLKGPFAEVISHDQGTVFRVRKADCEAAVFLEPETFTHRTVDGPFANSQLV